MDSPTIAASFLESARYRFRSIKDLGDKALAQVSDADLLWSPDGESNSIAVIVQHLHGNMMSRWTDFLTTDGEKNRDRDGEFVAQASTTRTDILARWEQGWQCLFRTLESLRPEDLAKEVAIRGQKLGVIDAIHRQIAHYGYHVGQIVYIAKHLRGEGWQTLSIARNRSGEYRPARRD